MVNSKLISRVIGITCILVAFFILFNSIISYVSPLPYISSNDEESSTSFGTGVTEVGALLTVRVNVIDVGSHIEVPIPYVGVIVTRITNDEQGSSTIMADTGKDGSITFKLPPGDYLVGTNYLGMIVNTTTQIPSEKTHLIVNWNFNRATPKSFTLQLQDFDEIGMVFPGDFLFSHCALTEVEKPLIVEVINLPTQPKPLNQILFQLNRIALLGVVGYEQNGENIWLTLTPIVTLSVKEIYPTTNLSLALYWPNVEVLEIS